MALTDSATMKTLTDALGNAWASLASTIDTNNSLSAVSATSTARGVVSSNTTETDYDAATSLADSLHTIYKTIIPDVTALYSNIPTILNTYTQLVVNDNFRHYFATGLTWSANFKNLWRIETKQELIARLGSVTNTGSWGSFVADQTIQLDSNVEIHTTSNIGNAAIAATIHYTKSDNTTGTLIINIPANTPTGTIIAGSTSIKFITITSVTTTGGSSGDSYEIWIV